MEPLVVVEPRGARVPVLLSCPHVGVEFPPDVGARLHEKFVRHPEDTDWRVHELYGFAPELGITVVHARYSRYVVDLNRDPASRPLYSDGRRETELVPTRSFAGEALYPDGGEPDDLEKGMRLERYYWPYHRWIDRWVEEHRRKHRHVLFFDAHSIARFVPTIRPEPFPDLILGSGDGHTAHARLIDTALAGLGGGAFSLQHNDPFKGGHLTRRIGRPAEGVHALQLEMSQDVYLAAGDTRLDAERAPRIQAVLRKTLTDLVAALGRMA